MRYSWNQDVSLDWGQVFVNTVECLAGLALEGWEENISFEGQEVDVSAGSQFTTKLVLRLLRREIETKYLICGLYESGLQIAQHYTLTYRPKLHAGIVLGGRPIAFLSYGPRQPGLACNLSNSTILVDDNYPAINVSTAASRQSGESHLSSTSSILTANSGTVIDYGDNKLKVIYEYDSVKIPAFRIFTAYLDALATAAVHDRDGTGAEVVAYSKDHRVSLLLRRNLSCGDFKWGVLIQALRLVWQQLIIRYHFQAAARWEGLTFLIQYDGNLVGEGFLLDYDGPPDALASSR